MTQALSTPVTQAGTPPGPLREFWIAFSANRGAVIGMGVVAGLLLLALFAPWLAPAPAGPDQQRRVPEAARPGRPAARWNTRWAPTRSAATSSRG